MCHPKAHADQGDLELLLEACGEGGGMRVARRVFFIARSMRPGIAQGHQENRSAKIYNLRQAW